MFHLPWAKPKFERFSLDNLKRLCDKLQTFPKDAKEDDIVSCLKELTQLLIWSDQHDPLLLEHFFEQDVHWHFLKILQGPWEGSLIVQVLQTLNIMFENVRSQESLYFLLSNNYVNQVIGLKYDFSNDEILAYYIYLLRTLSFKLTADTIYFFFNEHLDDFPLYSEAIKFFNHEESMIRIAVRVITLNVYKVEDPQMQDFVLERTTPTYFSNLVWYIGNYGTMINDMLLHPSEGELGRMDYYLAEHMDCYYYINDIVEIDSPKVNKLLISYLLNRLLRPVYLEGLLPANAVFSTTTAAKKSPSSMTRLSPLVSISLLLHAFLVLKHAPLVSALVSALFSNNNHSSSTSHSPNHHHHHGGAQNIDQLGFTIGSDRPRSVSPGPQLRDPYQPIPLTSSNSRGTGALSPKPAGLGSDSSGGRNPYSSMIFGFLNNTQDDTCIFPALTLIYLICKNTGVMPDVLLNTDIYPQRLLKSKLLLGNLMSAENGKANGGASIMTRGLSSESLKSLQSVGISAIAGVGGGGMHIWSPKAITQSLSSGPSPPLRATGPSDYANTNAAVSSAAIAAATARLEQSSNTLPLFNSDSEDEDAKETDELLAAGSEEEPLKAASAPLSKTNVKAPLLGPLIENLPTAAAAIDAEAKKSRRRSRRSLLARKRDTELKPMTAADRKEHEKKVAEEIEELEKLNVDTSSATLVAGPVSPSGPPPPLPPRHKSATSTVNENITSGKTEGEPITGTLPEIKNRDILIERLMNILCRQPDSGYQHYRLVTVQMAAELLIEFLHVKGNVGNSGVNHGGNSEPATPVKVTAPSLPDISATASQQAPSGGGGSLLRPDLCTNLVNAEAKLRKAIKYALQEQELLLWPEAKPVGKFPTMKMEAVLRQSKVGMDKRVASLLSESSVMYRLDTHHDGGSGGSTRILGLLQSDPLTKNETKVMATLYRDIQWLHILVQCRQLVVGSAGGSASSSGVSGTLAQPGPKIPSGTEVSSMHPFDTKDESGMVVAPGMTKSMSTTSLSSLTSMTSAVNNPLLDNIYEDSDTIAGSPSVAFSAPILPPSLSVSLPTESNTKETSGHSRSRNGSEHGNGLHHTLRTVAPTTATTTASATATTAIASVAGGSSARSSVSGVSLREGSYGPLGNGSSCGSSITGGIYDPSSLDAMQFEASGGNGLLSPPFESANHRLSALLPTPPTASGASAAIQSQMQNLRHQYWNGSGWGAEKMNQLLRKFPDPLGGNRDSISGGSDGGSIRSIESTLNTTAATSLMSTSAPSGVTSSSILSQQATASVGGTGSAGPNRKNSFAQLAASTLSTLIPVPGLTGYVGSAAAAGQVPETTSRMSGSVSTPTVGDAAPKVRRATKSTAPSIVTNEESEMGAKGYACTSDEQSGDGSVDDHDHDSEKDCVGQVDDNENKGSQALMTPTGSGITMNTPGISLSMTTKTNATGQQSGSGFATGSTTATVPPPPQLISKVTIFDKQHPQHGDDAIQRILGSLGYL